MLLTDVVTLVQLVYRLQYILQSQAGAYAEYDALVAALNKFSALLISFYTTIDKFDRLTDGIHRGELQGYIQDFRGWVDDTRVLIEAFLLRLKPFDSNPVANHESSCGGALVGFRRSLAKACNKLWWITSSTRKDVAEFSLRLASLNTTLTLKILEISSIFLALQAKKSMQITSQLHGSCSKADRLETAAWAGPCYPPGSELLDGDTICGGLAIHSGEYEISKNDPATPCQSSVDRRDVQDEYNE